MRIFLIVTVSATLLALVTSVPVPVEDEAASNQGNVPSLVENPEPSNSIPESSSPGESEVEVDDQESAEYTPGQFGRLARFNGNFFQLYGFTEQFGANAEAFAGNFLNYKGNTLEFLGNEHSLRSLANYFRQVQQEYYEKEQGSSGRQAEIYKSQGDLGGEMAGLVEKSSDLEYNQAQLEFEQMKETADQMKLEIQQGRSEARQALTEINQGEIEEKQIKLENKFHGLITKYVELEKEMQDLEKGGEITPTEGAAAPALV